MILTVPLGTAYTDHLTRPGVHSGLFEAGGGSQQHVARLLFEGDVLGDPRVSQPEEVNAVAWHPHLTLPPNTTDWAALGAELLH